jgi:hypothetical protein
MATLTPDGLTIRNQDQIFSDMVARLKGRAGESNVDATPATPVGQILGTASRQIALIEEAIEDVYLGRDINRATGDALDMPLGLTGTSRSGDEYTRVHLDCDLDSGKTLESGSHWAEVDGDPSSRWTPEEDFTAPSNGVHAVWFRAEFVGPVEVAENTITVRATSVAGWNSVNNPTPEIVGKLRDSDTEARARHLIDLARAGSTTLAAIIQGVEKVPGVISASGRSNRTSEEANGLPAKSFRIVVYDGPTPTADNNAIAQAIFDESSTTAPTFGDESGIAVDENGENVLIYFSRIERIDVYIAITIQTKPGFVETDFKAWLASKANALAGNGVSVRWRRIDSLAFEYETVSNVSGFSMGTAPAPVSAADIIPTESQRAYFDASLISVVIV